MCEESRVYAIFFHCMRTIVMILFVLYRKKKNAGRKNGKIAAS